MWDLPRPGLEPMSPALAGGFSTTAPPGKSPHVFKMCFFKKKYIELIECFGARRTQPQKKKKVINFPKLNNESMVVQLLESAKNIVIETFNLRNVIPFINSRKAFLVNHRD